MGTKSFIMSGTFTYIELAKPVFHIDFLPRILKLMKCICFRCSKLLLDDDELNIEMKDIYEKFDLIYEKSKRKNMDV